jgi:diguanylate cyclase (GGDEF)-like protein/PAS domain S-box-containing protein
MTPAALPTDEAARLAALRALDVLDTPAEAEFDALVQAASTVCGTPISLVSLVDEGRQWFKANHGLAEATETPRNMAFCAHAILDDDLFVVHDATADERFADNPLVTGAPDIRFYAGAPVRLSDGHRVGTLCVIDRHPRQLDATQREVLISLSKAVARALEGRRAALQLRVAIDELEGRHQMLDATLRSIEDAVLATDAAGCIHWANPAAERLLGRSAQGLRGRPLRRAVALRSSSDRRDILAVLSNAVDGQSAALPADAVLHTADGQEIAVEGVASALRTGGSVSGAVLVLRDVSDKRRANAEVSFRASHDALTGLVNRGEFEHRLQDMLARRDCGALMFIDLDHFKVVNDRCGHAAGDKVLREVAGILRKAVRETDTVARLGGDEFAVLLSHCSMASAQRKGQAICDQLEVERFAHGEQRFRIGASIGLAPIGGELADLQSVLQAADGCAYAAKDAGRNRVVTWCNGRDVGEVHADGRWAERIQRALDDDGFELFGQQVVPLRSDAGALSLEVLLRMRNDDGSLVAPGAFMPAAERHHLMARVDRWVLRRTLAWMSGQPFDGPLQRVGVNLSGQSVADPTFRAWALQSLDEAGPELCGRLTLEITETVAIARLEEAAGFVRALQCTGARIALDDFGAGASTFGYLKSLPVDYLKIDGQFIRHLLTDPLDQAAVKCFVDVARAVGIKTVAEHVETDAVLARLRELGVDFAQGYLLHRPEPLDAASQVEAGDAVTHRAPARRLSVFADNRVGLVSNSV